MKKLSGSMAIMIAFLLHIPISSAQDTENTVVQLNPDSQQQKIQRQARIEELRQLTQEDRQARRRETRKQLESLTEEQRQALRDRRRQREGVRRQNEQTGRPARQNRPHRERVRRPSAESQVETQTNDSTIEISP
ncbi:MAG: hypothetical protein COA96_02050 [SAR86 cluster bacterium]|uniref:Uncharacterized protein n=1 Tax=SAR86 cluster bacterium TaxID=2030880 RepID=A0A2A5BA24_9GAMM|nr:MAG: hypothetical protein COA96_02050 [SAR86 cluster bacterium]